MGYTFRNNDLLLGRYSGSFFKEQVITPNSGSIILFDKNLNPTVVTTSSLYFNRLSASKLNVTSASIKYITSSIIDVSKRIVSRGPLQLFPTKDNNFPQVTSSFIYTSGSTNDIFFTHYHGTDKNTTRLSWIEGNLYTGLLNGGVLTATAGGSKFNLSGGKGIIVTLLASTSSLSQVSPDPNIKYVTWPTYTNVNLTYISSSRVTYIGIDNTGAIVQQTVPWATNDVNQYDSQLFLGVVAHLNGNKVTTAYNTPQTAYGISQKSDEFFRAFGPLKISGHTLYPSSSAVTLKLRKTSGKSYLDGANYIYNASHPDVIDDSALNVSKIYRYYISGSTPVVDSGVGGAGYTDVDPTQYVNGTGTLTSVPGGKITLQRVFWVPKNPVNSLLIYYGNTLYNSLDGAISNKDDEPFTEAPETAENAIFVAWIAIEGGATNLNDTAKVRIAQGGLFRNVGGIGGGGTTPFSNTLAGLSDVAISSPALGDLLVYGSGTQWNNTKTLNGAYTVNSLSITSSLTVNGNTTLGNASSDTLTVNATSNFTAPTTFTQLTASISGSKARFGRITGSDLRLTGGDIRFSVTTRITPEINTSTGYDLYLNAGNTSGPTSDGGNIYIRPGYGASSTGSIYIYDKVQIGESPLNSDTLLVLAKSTFTGQITASSIRVTGPSVLVGNTTLGDASSDTLTVGATSTFNAPATFNNSVTFNQLTGSISGSKARFGQITGSELRVDGDIRLGTTTLIQPSKPTTSNDGYNLSIFAGDSTGGTQVGGDLILRAGYGTDGSGSIRLRDNVVVGDVVANQDTLTVYSTTNFVGKISGSSIRITGNTTIGDASSDTLKIFATTTFNGPLTSSNFRTNGRLHVSSSANGAAFIVSTINQGPLNETNAAFIITGSRVGINTDDVDYNLEVNGSFAATTKSFVIDYKDKPGSKLVHASLEGPEHGVYVRGNTTSSKVFLPEYWNWLVNENNINVQLTSNKRYQELFVENIILNESSSYFTVKERGIKGWLNRLFKKPVNFSYVVHAERKDVPALKTEIKKRKTKKKY